MKTKPRAKNVLKAISLFQKGLKPMEIASVLKTAASDLAVAAAVAKQQKMLRNKLRKAETMLRNLRKLMF